MFIKHHWKGSFLKSLVHRSPSLSKWFLLELFNLFWSFCQTKPSPLIPAYVGAAAGLNVSVLDGGEKSSMKNPRNRSGAQL